MGAVSVFTTGNYCCQLRCQEWRTTRKRVYIFFSQSHARSSLYFLVHSRFITRGPFTPQSFSPESCPLTLGLQVFFHFEFMKFLYGFCMKVGKQFFFSFYLCIYYLQHRTIIFTIYFIPLNFRAPLIFAHLARTKIEGRKFAH